MRRSLLLLTAFVAACADTPLDSPVREAPSMANQSSSNASHFTFLSPLDPNPSYGGAAFNPNLATFIEVCEASGSNGACPDGAPIVASIGPSADGSPSTGIVVSTDADGFYHANWKLADAPLQPGSEYRLNVLTGPSAMGGDVLGSLRLIVDSNGSGKFIGDDGESSDVFTSTQTIPVKYRVEKGALCITPDDNAIEPCTEGLVGWRGGLFVTADGLAGVEFPENALPGGMMYNIIIERYEEELAPSCLPTDDPQYTGCYWFRLEPQPPIGQNGHQFQQRVVVAICPDPDAYAFHEQLELWKWDGDDEDTFMILEDRDTVTWLDCPGWDVEQSGLSQSSSRLGAMLRGLLGIMTPQPAYAAMRGISPFGGGLYDFSRIGWVHRVRLEAVTDLQVTAVAGNAVEPDPVVRAVAIGGLNPDGNLPAPNVDIEFVPGAGSGTVNPTTDVTDAFGLASTTWTLAATTGPQTMTAYVAPTGWPNASSNTRGASVQFTANSIPDNPPGNQFLISVYEPVRDGARLGRIGGLDVQVVICNVRGQGCDEVARLDADDLVTKTNFYQGAWQSPSNARGSYRMQFYVENVLLTTVNMEVAKKGSQTSTTYVFNPGQNVPIKFAVVPK